MAPPIKMEGARYRRLRRTCVAIRAESDTAGRRPSFRGKSATDSENAQNSGRVPVGISGRVPVGMGGRLASESVAGMGRNTQAGAEKSQEHLKHRTRNTASFVRSSPGGGTTPIFTVGERFRYLGIKAPTLINSSPIRCNLQM